MAWASIASALLKVLVAGITIPVWVLVAGGVWLWYDHASSLRQAVDRAVTELVDGAELEAERARTRALETVNAELQGRAAALEDANEKFAESLQQVQLSLESANEQIIDLTSQPVNSNCVVDKSVVDRLRNR